jgi:hypothetical protein
VCTYQCSGSMNVWFGSGTADPCLWLTNPDSDLDSDPDPQLDADPDPYFFVIDLQEANKKHIFFEVFLLFTFWWYI